MAQFIKSYQNDSFEKWADLIFFSGRRERNLLNGETWSFSTFFFQPKEALKRKDKHGVSSSSFVSTGFDQLDSISPSIYRVVPIC